MTEHYNNDNRDRLTGMNRGTLLADNSGIETPLVDATLARTQQWTNLDHRGNWIDYRETVGTVTKKRMADASPTNEYTCMAIVQASATGTCSSKNPHVTPQYDFAGNMSSNPLARNVGDSGTGCSPAIYGCPSGQWYKYDEENRVIEIHRGSSVSGQLLLQFKYDALGRRVETIEYIDPQTGATWDGLSGRPPPRHTRHIYSGLESVQEYACGPGTASWSCGGYALIREFVWGDSNRFPEPVAMIWHSLAEAPPPPLIAAPHHAYHFLRDALGSIVGLTDSSGNLVERYTYDPYGKTFIEHFTNGTWVATNASSYGNPWLWTGQRYDAATGTYHFWARTYSPTLGRWLQRDPIGYADGVNLYEYVSGNPEGWVDPLGLITFRDLANNNKCLKALRDLMWKLSREMDREISGELKISKNRRLTVIMRVGERYGLHPEKWWPAGFLKPESTVGLIHTHQVQKRAEPGVPQDPNTGGHERGASDLDKDFQNQHHLPGAVIHWKDDPKNPENETKPTEVTTTFFGPKADDELPRDVDESEGATVTWTDMRTGKLIKVSLPEECKKKKKDKSTSCPSSAATKSGP